MTQKPSLRKLSTLDHLGNLRFIANNLPDWMGHGGIQRIAMLDAIDGTRRNAIEDGARTEWLDTEVLAHAIHEAESAVRGGCGNHTESWDDHLDGHRQEAQLYVTFYDRLTSERALR